MTTLEQASSEPLAVPSLRPLGAIAAAGLAAGVCDLVAACVASLANGGSVERVLRAIASGWLGAAAREGGSGVLALGFASHFLIATIWAAFYVLLSRRFKVLIERPWIAGPLYGLLVYGVMYRVVLPLSAIGQAPPVRLQAVGIHLLFVGLPIALAASRVLRGDER
jgi:hypothetical protein